MKVILLKTVPKLGKKDDIVEVSEGYARNALLAKKLAVPATEQAVAAVKRAQQNKVTEKKIQHELLDKSIQSLEGKTLRYHAKKNDKGSLFSKVTELDISKALLAQRVSIDAKLMTLAAGPIKQAGSYAVQVRDGEYQSEFTVTVE